MAIRLLIADAYEVVRAGLKSMLAGTGIRIVAEASDGKTALKLARKQRPDLVLLALPLPDGNGFD